MIFVLIWLKKISIHLFWLPKYKHVRGDYFDFGCAGHHNCGGRGGVDFEILSGWQVYKEGCLASI